MFLSDFLCFILIREVAVSKSMQVVKLYWNKIFWFLTGAGKHRLSCIIAVMVVIAAVAVVFWVPMSER